MSLDALADRLAPDFAHVGLALWHGGQATTACRSADGLAVMTPQSLLRVASLSKIVTGQVALDAAGGDDGVVLDALFERHLRPDGVTVRLRDVLSHTSGLGDGAPIAPGADLDTVLSELDWAAPVGARFAYANPGYLLAALAAERLAGRGFADLTQVWLASRDLTGGFNWAGVASRDRRLAVPVGRSDGPVFVPHVDAVVPGAGVVWADGSVCDTLTATALSPQGGLRLSLDGALALARSVPTLDARVLHDPGPAEETELYDQYGAGLMILRRPSFYPRPLIGHFANAYGLCGGAWWDAEGGVAFAYLLNGLPMGDEDDRLRPAERAIFAGVAELL